MSISMRLVLAALWSCAAGAMPVNDVGRWSLATDEELLLADTYAWRLLRNSPVSNVTIPWLPDEWTANINRLAQRINLHVLLVPVLLGFALLVLVLSSIVSSGRWGWKREETPTEPVQEPAPLEDIGMSAVGLPAGKPVLHAWSVMGIIALTSYRFYTGFLSATWMPYLLAMEGRQLMGSRQSFFMGSAKLIYGTSILLNPMFGLLGDQMATVSHWSGRRLFVLMGVGAGGLGIYGCVVAAQIESVCWYLAATVLWMLGEAMADVTTETLVPELLPRSQYSLSSAIRALNFLLGGLVGYAALIIFRHFHYSWLYYGYLLVMLVCALLTLCFINADDLDRQPMPRHKELPLTALVTQAYYLPARLEGGFPRACLCLFIFSLGSAPMFFLLLMVRDVIGIQDRVNMQMHFSIISIVFFVSAAVASALGAAGGGDADEVERSDRDRAKVREAVVQRWTLMVWSTVVFGVVAGAIPLVGFLPTLLSRKICFYFVAVAFGMSFGSVYARFQECTWSLLPTGVDVANAMGFAAMSKLAGVGIGNFGAGIILDFYSESESESGSYTLTGYVIMCFCASLVVLMSARLAHSVAQTALATFDKTSLRSD